MIPFWDIIQGSPEWWEVRKSVPTTSEFRRIITPANEEFSKGAATYAAELVAQKISLHAPPNVENYTTRAMRFGREMESEARAEYRNVTGNHVRLIGFCKTNDGRFGSSPDGIITNDPEAVEYYSMGALELKCPEAKTHMAWLLGPSKGKARDQWEADGRLPLAHKCQVHGELIVTGLPFAEFFSYSSGCPNIRIKVVPNSFTLKMREAMERFWELYLECQKKVS